MGAPLLSGQPVSPNKFENVSPVYQSETHRASETVLQHRDLVTRLTRA